ncbi:extracellular solute-binding protein [Gluconacetobacter sp. Hr-1-5]|uniref:extracellular solute-binding protein n=1 Tax=Gluconacetobacter sp. Hr-1-5 TaxID=3395370 RepID=UPI003B528219
MSTMIDYEIKRVLEFINRSRVFYGDRVPLAEPDPHWNIVSHVILRALAGQTVTISGLVQVAGVPYGTASRHVHRMIENGLLIKRQKTAKGRSYLLSPSPLLFESVSLYAETIKIEMMRIFGERRFAAEDDYFFGGEHQTCTVTDSHFFSVKAIPAVDQVRFLLHRDFFFASVRHMWSDFRRMIGPSRNFELKDLSGLYDQLLDNAARAESQFDVVAINIAWLGEFARQGLLHPLDMTPPVDDDMPWMSGQWRGRHYARPIYGAIELLAARRDWFEEAGLTRPRQFADIIAAGRALHAPGRSRYGIVWSAGRGIPVARSFMMLLGNRNIPALEGLNDRGDGDRTTQTIDRLCALLQSDTAVGVLDDMQQLLTISPSDILEAEAEQILETFMDGRAAMAYIWSMHAMRFEIDIRSNVKRRVTYLAQPTGLRGIRRPIPLDGFLLAIPANLPPERLDRAYRVLSWLSSPDAIRGRMRDGIPVAPLFSVTSDPEATSLAPIYSVIGELKNKNMLHFWKNPPVPEYAHFQQVLGEEIHDALLGLKNPVEALRNAAARIMAA